MFWFQVGYRWLENVGQASTQYADFGPKLKLLHYGLKMRQMTMCRKNYVKLAFRQLRFLNFYFGQFWSKNQNSELLRNAIRKLLHHRTVFNCTKNCNFKKVKWKRWNLCDLLLSCANILHTTMFYVTKIQYMAFYDIFACNLWDLPRTLLYQC